VTLFMAWGRLAPTHLGTELLIGQKPRDIADLVLSVGPREAPLAERRVGDWRFEPAEAIAFLSQHVQLRGGDVIGLGSALAVEPAWGESVALSLGKLLRLEGRAQPAPAPPPWRLNR
jgi:2-keto-4-pentenoate hydratase/2-oxohepta-3-ene-1,7-dioic acid hydratase in catechol pathway